MTQVIPSALIELSLRPWGRQRAGVIVDRTPERIVELWPSFPLPGPNHVSLIRCAPGRVVPLVAEVRAVAAARGLRCAWLLDPDAMPLDLPERLAACGILPNEELDVMVLPATAEVEAPAGVEVVDALRDAATFAASEAVQAAAFGEDVTPGQRERFEEALADPARHCFLALVNGEAAGAGWATVHAGGVLMNGGAVAPPFRGRGVYRALVSERLALARRAGAPGLGTQAKPDTSGPILARLGFTTVGRWRQHLDRAG